jgi:hypothetical protein
VEADPEEAKIPSMQPTSVAFAASDTHDPILNLMLFPCGRMAAAKELVTKRRKVKLVKNKSIVSTVFGVVLLVSATGVGGLAQGEKSGSTPELSLLARLPRADGVAVANVRRLLDEALPKMLAGNPDKLAAVNAELDKFKEKTAIDPRAMEFVAVGVRYSYPRDGVTKVDSVAIASGSFNSGALVAAGRIAANGKYREETRAGKTIYIFSLTEQIKLLGLLDLKIHELAIAPLDAGTLAIGAPEGVREVVDLASGNHKSNGNEVLVALAAKNPDAVIGFGSNVSPELLKNLDIGNDAIAQDVSAVRQVYGSLGLTAKDLELLLAARTTGPQQAKNLSDTISSLKQFGALFIQGLHGAKGSLARTALDNLKVTTQGNELQVRTAVAQIDLAPLMGGSVGGK